jgi:hypothetical protein
MQCDASDVCNEDPSLCACDGFFPIFRQAATSVQPGEGALDDLPPRQHLKALRGVRAFDDLDGPSAEGL